MKLWIIIVLSSSLLFGLVLGAFNTLDKNLEKTNEKSSDKIYPKKVQSFKKKPTKSLAFKSPIDSFKDLPDDDLEFIKELDKQFKLHGDKIKIKVEQYNATNSKNSKRTVEGDLGYGYYNGQESTDGYDYPKPKYTFYPYSQRDIPPSAPGYHIKEEDQSTISIIPSYAYELKQNSHGGYETKTSFVPSQPDLGPTHGYNQQEEGNANQNEHQQVISQGQENGHNYQYNEPVIVLRIPGPPKYATHLQSLLQQYLEIRAAQYLKILEEAELQKQQQQQQRQQHQYQQYDQIQEKPQVAYHQIQEKPQQASYDHPQQSEEPQNYALTDQQYPGIDDVYQSFKERQQEQHQQVVESQYNQPAIHHDEQSQQYFYVNVPKEQSAHTHTQTQDAAERTTYQTMYYYAMEPPDYGQHTVYVVPQGYADSSLPITENHPRNTHTKIQFTDVDNTDHSTQYPLPSIKPFERHSPKTTSIHDNNSYQVHNGEAQNYEGQRTDQQHYHASSSSAPEVVSITQRPFNYHAHSLRSKSSKRNSSPTSVSSTAIRIRTPTQMNRQNYSDKILNRRGKKESV